MKKFVFYLLSTFIALSLFSKTNVPSSRDCQLYFIERFHKVSNSNLSFLELKELVENIFQESEEAGLDGFDVFLQALAYTNQIRFIGNYDLILNTKDPELLSELGKNFSINTESTHPEADKYLTPYKLDIIQKHIHSSDLKLFLDKDSKHIKKVKKELENMPLKRKISFLSQLLISEIGEGEISSSSKTRSKALFETARKIIYFNTRLSKHYERQIGSFDLYDRFLYPISMYHNYVIYNKTIFEKYINSILSLPPSVDVWLEPWNITSGSGKTIDYPKTSKKYQILTFDDIWFSANEIIESTRISKRTDFELTVLEIAYIYFKDIREKLNREYRGGFVKYLENKIKSMPPPEWLAKYNPKLLRTLFLNTNDIEWNCGCNNRKLCKGYCQFMAKQGVRSSISIIDLRYIAYHYGHLIDYRDWDNNRSIVNYFASDPLQWKEETDEGDLNIFHASSIFFTWIYFKNYKEFIFDDYSKYFYANTVRVNKDTENLASIYRYFISSLSVFNDNKPAIQLIRNTDPFLGLKEEVEYPAIRHQQKILDTGEYALTPAEWKKFWSKDGVSRRARFYSINITSNVILKADSKDPKNFKFYNIINIMYPTDKIKTDLYIPIAYEFTSDFETNFYFETPEDLFSKSIVKIYRNDNQMNKLKKRIDYLSYNQILTEKEKHEYLIKQIKRKNFFNKHFIFDENGVEWVSIMNPLTGECYVLNKAEYKELLESNKIQDHRFMNGFTFKKLLKFIKLNRGL